MHSTERNTESAENLSTPRMCREIMGPSQNPVLMQEGM